jgi:hypothetical protein
MVAVNLYAEQGGVYPSALHGLMFALVVAPAMITVLVKSRLVQAFIGDLLS